MLKNLILFLTLFLTSAAFSISSIEIKKERNNLDLNVKETKVRIFQVLINNDDPNGFSLTFDSHSGGFLGHESVFNPNRTGSFLKYKISIKKKSGEWGAKLQTGTNLNDIFLKKPYTIFYNRRVRKPTIDGLLKIQISHNKKKKLFSGRYADTITVIMTNL